MLSFQSKVKNQQELLIELHLWNLVHLKSLFRVTMVVTIIYEHFQLWIMLILFFCLVVILSVLFKIKPLVTFKLLFSNVRKHDENYIN